MRPIQYHLITLPLNFPCPLIHFKSLTIRHLLYLFLDSIAISFLHSHPPSGDIFASSLSLVLNISVNQSLSLFIPLGSDNTHSVTLNLLGEKKNHIQLFHLTHNLSFIFTKLCTQLHTHLLSHTFFFFWFLPPFWIPLLSLYFLLFSCFISSLTLHVASSNGMLYTSPLWLFALFHCIMTLLSFFILSHPTHFTCCKHNNSPKLLSYS